MIEVLEDSSGKSYDDPQYQKMFRIVIDHIKSSVLMLSDDLTPSNKQAGYILRRLIRRAVLNMEKIDFNFTDTIKLISAVSEKYGEAYPDIKTKKDFIERELLGEIEGFKKTLKKGMREFEKIIDPENKANNIRKIDFGRIENTVDAQNEINTEDAFRLVSTYGFPKELIVEEAQKNNIYVDFENLEKKLKEHSSQSSSASAGKFKSGLGGDSEKIVAFHTATHLLLGALRKFLGESVHQRGSNITEERARFDFTCGYKVGRDVLDQIEDYINMAIEKGGEVLTEEMKKEDAKASGVEGSFWEKYPEIVKV
jgi:alanyl-tRNA synthetase